MGGHWNLFCRNALLPRISGPLGPLGPLGFNFSRHGTTTRSSHIKDCRESIYTFGSRLALQCRGSCRGDKTHLLLLRSRPRLLSAPLASSLIAHRPWHTRPYFLHRSPHRTPPHLHPPLPSALPTPIAHATLLPSLTGGYQHRTNKKA